MNTRRTRTIIIAAAILVMPALSGAALSPTIILGAYGQSGAGSLPPSSGATYGGALVDTTFGVREPSGEQSYWSLSARASLLSYLVALTGWEDAEQVDLGLGVPAGHGSLIFGGGLSSSGMNQELSGSYVWPYWSGEYRLQRGPRGFQPSITYSGAYLWENAGIDDRFAENVTLKLAHAASARFESFALLEGAWELWLDQPLVNASGTATGELRRDYRAVLSLGGTGFLGYALDWSADLRGGIRSSNANLYLTSTPQLVADSESRLIGGANAGVTWVPNSRLSIGLLARIDEEVYLNRTALDASGLPTANALNVAAVGGELKVSWSTDGKLYYVLRGGASRSFANDPSFEEWALTANAGLQYSF